MFRRPTAAGGGPAAQQGEPPAAPPPPGQVQAVYETHGTRVVQHLHLVAAELLEDEAHRHVGLAVEGAELPAGVELDDGEARVPDRDAPEVVGAVIRALGARRATGRALGRRSARRAQPPGAPFGVELPGPGVLALRRPAAPRR